MAFPSFAVVSVLVSAVLAQSNPLIPSGISSACNSYLMSFNNDASFTACTNPFTSALAQFAPGSGTTPSIASIASTLDTLCSSDAFSACPQSDVTTQLGSFYAACSAELTSAPSLGVRTLYDVLYVLTPLRQAMCAKDDAGNYCATKLSNSSSTGSVALVDSQRSQTQSLLSKYLYTTSDSTVVARDLSNTTAALVPNTTTFQDTNLVFLFLEPSESSSALCTTCTRNIITKFLLFESNYPYGPGLSNSLLLAGQVYLYGNITSKCGQGFLAGAVGAAGLANGLVSGAAPLAVGQELSAAVGAILGVAAFIAASL